MLGNQIKKFLINLLVFLLPTQLAYHFWPDYAFIFGIRVDYLSPAIYLTDILVIALIFLNYKKLLKHKKLFLIIALFAVFNIAISNLYQVSLFLWAKLIEYLTVAIILRKEEISMPLYYSLVFFSLIGIAQFLISKTTGLFYFLGERTFDINTPGIALAEFFGATNLRVYSTFPHPNVLAGYFGLSTIYLIEKKFKFNWLFTFPLICFLLTFSLSAYIGVLGYFILRNRFNKYFLLVLLVLSLLLPLFSPYGIKLVADSSLAERFILATESGKVISQNFWFGSGLGTFVKYSSLRQPVHNLFLLVFSELGLLGVTTLLALLYRYLKKYKFILFILLVGLFDHYFLTIPQSTILLFLITSLW